MKNNLFLKFFYDLYLSLGQRAGRDGKHLIPGYRKRYKQAAVIIGTVCFASFVVAANFNGFDFMSLSFSSKKAKVEQVAEKENLKSDKTSEKSALAPSSMTQGPACVNSGIVTWQRADDGTSAPSIWNDYSGQGNTAVQNTATRQPAVGSPLNYNPTFDFNGSSTFYQFNNDLGLTGQNSHTIFSVVMPEKIDNFHFRGIIGGKWNANTFGWAARQGAYQVHWAGVGPTKSGPALTIGEATMGTVVRNGTSTHTMYKEGLIGGSTAGLSWNHESSPMQIGAFHMPGPVNNPYINHFDGKIAEVIVYNRPLNNTELQKVHSYLSLKYGLTLANGTQDYLASDGSTKMWTILSNAGYVNDIAGIGRDNCTGLHQTMARSANSDALISFGVGSGVNMTGSLNNAANIAAGNTITNDLSFFTWANNNAATNFDQPVNIGVAGAPKTRLARVWKMDKTNWTDKNITFHYLGTQGTNLYLIVSNNSTFATITKSYALNGSHSITLNSADIADGAFFTVAGVASGAGCVTSGIVAWQKADDGTSNNSVWVDQSGMGNNATQSSVMLQPTLSSSINFNPAYDFNGSTQFLGYSSDLGLKGQNSHTLVGVVMPDHIDNFNHRGIIGGTWSAHTLGWNVRQGAYQVHWAGVGPTKSGPSVNVNEVSIGAVVRDGVTSHKMYKEGIVGGSTSGLSWNHDSSPMLLGAFHMRAPSSPYKNYFNGKIAEMVVYNRALGELELQKIHSYLAIKYGVTLANGTMDYLASDGTTKLWGAAANAGYINDIAGIGKDDCTGLHQTMSKSVNNDALVAFGIGSGVDLTGAVKNQANITAGNVIANDMSAFVWSNNNASVDFSQAVTIPVPTAPATRMARVWKVSKTNWADTNVTFSYSGAIGTNFYLLVSTDPNFSTLTSFYPLSLDKSVTVNTANIPNGAYFTIAAEFQGPACVREGIVTWQRGDDPTSNNGIWNDVSGNNNAATQNDPARQPKKTGRINFNPAFNFNGNTQFFSYPGHLGLYGQNSHTVLGVVMPDRIDYNYRGIIGGEWQVQPWGWTVRNNKYAVHWAGNGSTKEGPSITAGEVSMGTVVQNGTASHSMYREGIAGGSSTGLAWNTTPRRMQIGQFHESSSSGGDYWNNFFGGKIGELIVYDKALTNLDLKKIHSYLALKYGLTLANGAEDYVAGDGVTKMWEATSNGGYQNDIAGLGRDDCSGLHQTMAKSSNPDASVSFAVGSSVDLTGTIDNPDNIGLGNVIATDRSFLVWSNNDATISFDQPVTIPVSGAPTTRMSRVWKVDKTNWTDTNITFHYSGFLGTNFYLLISGDPAFSTLTKFYALDGSNSITLNSSDLPDGVYFTVAGEVQGPACISEGIVTWQRADDGISSGNTWVDYSGKGNVATQSESARIPSLTGIINYNPAYDFDGQAEYLNYPNDLGIAGLNSHTIFGVVLPEKIDNFNYRGILGGAWPANTFGWAVRQGAYQVHKAGTGPTKTGPSLNTGEVSLGSVVRNGTAVHLMQKEGITGGATSGLNWDFESSPMLVGAFHMPGPATTPYGNYFDGKIAELVVFDRVLDAAERQRVNSYMSLKYGVTLANGTQDYIAGDGVTKMWEAAANTGYTNDIAGLGRDNCAILHQTMSKSVNKDALVSFAIGSNVDLNGGMTNPANIAAGNEILNDRSFFVWSNNNGSIGFDQAVNIPVSGAPATRMARVWKVDKTNWADTQVTFSFSGEMGTNHYLIVSSTPSFASIAHSYALDDNLSVTLSSSDLADGAYFTIAGEFQGPGCVRDGIVTWQRGDDEVSSDAVWFDFSGNGNTSVQDNVSRQPSGTGQINFHRAFDFNGSSSFFEFDNDLGLKGQNSHTIFGVILPETIDNFNHRGILGGKWSAYTLGWAVRSNSYEVHWAGNGSTKLGPSLTTGNISMGTVVRNGTSAHTMYKDGLIGGTTSGLNWNPASSSMLIGAFHEPETSSYTNYFDGKIAEVIVYNRALTNLELQKVHSYLSFKYGLTYANGSVNYLAGDGVTKMWNSSTAGVYRYDVAGIGRDDCNKLEQKQSASVNSDAIVTMGLGTIAATNLDNPNSFSTDKSFMFWSNNNAALSEITSEIPAVNVTKRLAREWKIQETGVVGKVKVAFNINGLTLSGTTAADFSLMMDDDGNFSNGGTTFQSASSYAGDVVSFDNVDFANGSYFTLATQATVCNVQIAAVNGVGNCQGDGTYPISVNIIHSNPSTAGFTINGQQFAYTTSPQNVVLSLPGDGQPITLVAFDNMDPTACRDSFVTGFTAPDCGTESCSFAITGVDHLSISSCNSAGNTFTVPVTVSFNNPVGGAFTLNGQTFAYTTSPQTISLTLPATGSPVTLTGGDDSGTGCSDEWVDALVAPQPCAVVVRVKVALDGAFNPSTGQMGTALASQGLLPISDPYGVGTSTVINPGVFTFNGKSVVDWVLVELRSASNNTTIAGSAVGFLLADGTVVNTFGQEDLSFNLPVGSYYVAVKHRNHLSAMTGATIHLSGIPVSIDFTSTSLSLYGANTMRINGSIRTLWSGDANGDNKVAYTGSGSDVNAISSKVLSDPANQGIFSESLVIPGYAPTDLNLDGKTIYIGPGTDLTKISTTVLLHPSNSIFSTSAIILEQLP